MLRNSGIFRLSSVFISSKRPRLDFFAKISHSFLRRTSTMTSTNATAGSGDGGMLDTLPVIYCFGDSLTQWGYSENGGWLSLLSNELIRRCDVINRGFSGYNTRWCRMILPRLLDVERAKNIACATVFLGANDSVLQELNPAQHVPVAEFKDNLTAIVDYFMSVGVEREKIILIAPPPCDEDKYTAYCKQNDRTMSKSLSQTKLYAETCSEVAKDSGVECVDLFTIMTKTDDWTKYLDDGLHFSKEGSEFLFKTVWPSIDQRTKHFTFALPDWKEINYGNPTESLSK